MGCGRVYCYRYRGKVMEMLVKMAEVLVKIAMMMVVATAAFRRHRKTGERGPLLLLLP